MSYLAAIVEWLNRNLGAGLTALFKELGRIRWFAVAVVSVLVGFLEVGVGWFVAASGVFLSTAEFTKQSMQQLAGNLGAASGAVSSAAGLANCVLPVTECFAYGSMLLALWVTLFGVKTILAIWRLIPFKAS